MSVQHSDGVYRQQDGQVLQLPGRGKEPHPQWRWDIRADSEWEDYPVRVAWREAAAVDLALGGDAYARYHVESRMLLIAEYGVLRTAEHLFRDCPDARQERVMSQVGGHDE